MINFICGTENNRKHHTSFLLRICQFYYDSPPSPHINHLSYIPSHKISMYWHKIISSLNQSNHEFSLFNGILTQIHTENLRFSILRRSIKYSGNKKAKKYVREKKNEKRLLYCLYTDKEVYSVYVTQVSLIFYIHFSHLPHFWGFHSPQFKKKKHFFVQSSVYPSSICERYLLNHHDSYQ